MSASSPSGEIRLRLWGGPPATCSASTRSPPTHTPRIKRLSRYDCTGLVWLLQGHPVVALTEATAAIRMPSGNVTTYRKHNKPAFGPLGDSLDDFLA